MYFVETVARFVESRIDREHASITLGGDETHALGDAVPLALHMSKSEQRERLRVTRDVVRGSNVYRWAGQILADAPQLRNAAASWPWSMHLVANNTGGVPRVRRVRIESGVRLNLPDLASCYAGHTVSA